jgi:hypothetical protein
VCVGAGCHGTSGAVTAKKVTELAIDIVVDPEFDDMSFVVEICPTAISE